MRQYKAARDAVWRGAQRRGSLEHFKSVYSIFISRVDVYTEKQVPSLSPAAQGQVGIVGAKRLWLENRAVLVDAADAAETGNRFSPAPARRSRKIRRGSMSQSLAGSDIQTNPPATNEAVEKSGLTFTRMVDKLPPAEVLAEIDAKVDEAKLEEQLMREGVAEVRRSAACIAQTSERSPTLEIGVVASQFRSVNR